MTLDGPARGSSGKTVHQLEADLQSLMGQLESLERVAAGVVADDIDATLRQIAAGASGAVRAAGHVLAVRALLGGRPTVVVDGVPEADVAGIADELLATEPHGSRAGLLVSDVASAHRFYGRMAALPADGQSFLPEDGRLLAAYAGLAATALDAAASRESSDALLALARSLADLRGVDEVCEQVVRAIPVLVGSPKAAVPLWDAEREVITIGAVLGMGDLEDAFRSLEVRKEDTPELERMLVDPELRTFYGESADPFVAGALAAFGMSAVSIVPVVRRGELLGAIMLGWEDGVPGELDPEVTARLEGLAAQTATAIENARLLERTTRRAMHDALTGLPNRFLLEDRIAQAVARAQRDGSKVGVLLLDLDSFKVVNDTFGHRAGDRVLWAVGERLTAHLRPMDTAARLGGDEFVVVCPNVNGDEDVVVIAERIAAALVEPVAIDGERQVTIGASVGWTIADGTESDITTLLHAADEAMYRVKRQRSGRLPPAAGQLAASPGEERNVRR